LRRWIANIIEPGLDGDFGDGFGEIAEAEEIAFVGGSIQMAGSVRRGCWELEEGKSWGLGLRECH